MSCCSNDYLNCLVNHKAIIHCGRCKYLVVICSICPTYIKAIEVGSGNIKIFNLDRVDFIEEICC